MAKPKRGKNIKSNAAWRGLCPVCKRTGVKLLWTKVGDGGDNVQCCKRCGS